MGSLEITLFALLGGVEPPFNAYGGIWEPKNVFF